MGSINLVSRNNLDAKEFRHELIIANYNHGTLRVSMENEDISEFKRIFVRNLNIYGNHRLFPGKSDNLFLANDGQTVAAKLFASSLRGVRMFIDFSLFFVAYNQKTPLPYMHALDIKWRYPGKL
jgi:hypothetical protein